MRDLARFLKRHVREMKYHAQRAIRLPSGRRRVVIFPSQSGTGNASDLRAWALVPELERLGWRAVCVHPELDLSQRQRIVRLEKPDVILLQQARHPLNRPKYFRGVPCVFDADDADVLDPNCTDHVIECCEQSVAIVAGSRFLANIFKKYNSNVSIVWTGSYHHPPTPSGGTGRDLPIVAWAHSDPTNYPVEAQFVQQVVLKLAQRAEFTFSLYGVRNDQLPSAEAYLKPIREQVRDVKIHAPMVYTQFLQSLSSAAIGLHPVCVESPFSRGKSFGKILAYMIARVAIVTSNAVDHPLIFRDGVNGELVDNDPDLWASRCERLIRDPGHRQRIVSAASAVFSERLTTEKAAKLVGDQLELAVRLRQRV